MEHFLGDLKPGERACVECIQGGGAIRRRMMDMGIVPGVELEVVRRAPFGGPLQVRLKGYYLAMRRGECAKIVVTETREELIDPINNTRPIARPLAGR
jgi:ferrous iron transport protein A